MKSLIDSICSGCPWVVFHIGMLFGIGVTLLVGYWRFHYLVRTRVEKVVAGIHAEIDRLEGMVCRRNESFRRTGR